MHETEGALVVRAERPAEVLAQIATLSSIGHWALEPRLPQAIEDVYFDDERRSLGRRRIALRIRRVDAVVLLTMKSPLRREGGVTTRTEVEAPWSADALRRVVAELDLGSGSGVSTPSPEAALRELGLEPVQRRTTARERREVVAGDRAIAELTLDTVIYDLTPGALRLCEIEVEAKAPDADVGPILDALAARFETLVPWPHSKLATGFAAERAMGEGSLAPGTLTPSALDALERALG